MKTETTKEHARTDNLKEKPLEIIPKLDTREYTSNYKFKKTIKLNK